MSVPSGFQRHFDGSNPCATAAHDADGALCPWVPTLIKMSVAACTPLIVFLVRLAILKRRVSSNTYKDLETNAQAASLQQAKNSAALVTFGVQGGAAACGWLLMVFGLWSNFVMPDEWPLPPFFCMLPWPPGGALLSEGWVHERSRDGGVLRMERSDTLLSASTWRLHVR